MSDDYISLGSLPEDFSEMVMREFVPYSVALARVSPENNATFVPLGAGTLVKREGRIGILTARHCLKACSPQVEVGPYGKDTILLILRDARSVELRPEELFEHELTTPLCEEYGPDLAFLEISPGRLQTILAIASVWSLDRDPNEILKVFGGLDSMLAAVGFPEVRCETRIEGGCCYRTSYHLTCLHVIKEDSITQKNDWDYVDNRCAYSSSNPLPHSFEGYSGGGIWSIEVKRKNQKLALGRSALVGVSFYQTPVKDDVRHIRGHFVRSIYDLAWRNFARPASA